MAEQENSRTPNCLQCRHFHVTWDRSFPRGCRVFGVKSRKLPSVVVLETTGHPCPAFERAPGHKSSRNTGQGL